MPSRSLHPRARQVACPGWCPYAGTHQGTPATPSQSNATPGVRPSMVPWASGPSPPWASRTRPRTSPSRLRYCAQPPGMECVSRPRSGMACWSYRSGCMLPARMSCTPCGRWRQAEDKSHKLGCSLQEKYHALQLHQRKCHTYIPFRGHFKSHYNLLNNFDDAFVL